ncbi:MAG TPA: alpha-L-fucosidase, partial [Puia sp.]
MNKHLFKAAVLAAFLPLYSFGQDTDIIRKAAHVTPSERQLHWQQLELTAFFHFGINTFTGREWGDGKEDISQFNPTDLDAGQWVKTMKDAGFKQVILTAKHHDGFCLWPSKYTEHSIRNTPYKQGKGDIVKEVAAACKKYGVGFGIYLSPWDRNASFYGDSARYNDYFLHQLTELLTNYGRVDEVWFDGANGEGPNGKVQVYDFSNWYKLIRRLQPQAVIAVMGPDVRWVGTESGVGRETEWSVLPVDEQRQEAIAAGSQKDALVAPKILGNHSDNDLGGRNKIINAKKLVWYPAETDVSIRPGWFYHQDQDDKVKSPERLMETYFTSVGRNGVLLLNVPPDKRGRISDSDVESLRGFGKMLKATFADNLAKRAVIREGDGGSDTTPVIHIDLDKPQTFDILSLQENIALGQRIEKFSAEYYDGSQWKEFARGTTVGYKRLLRFDAVTAQKIRLNILSSRLKPVLGGIGLYRTPGAALQSGAAAHPRAAAYAGEWFATPAHIPNPLVPDAPIAGNGDVGMVYAGAPEKQQFYFSKNDFWKAQIGYPNGGVCLAGGLTVEADELKGASVYMKQQIGDGSISSVYKTSATTFRQQSWVYAKSNLAIITLSVEGKLLPVHVSLWADDKFGATVKRGSTGGVSWITRNFDYRGLDWPSHVGIAMRVWGGAGESFLLKPGAPVTIVVSLKTNHETAEPLQACIRDLKKFRSGDKYSLWRRHVQWWDNFWSQSSVVLGDTTLEKYYYGAQYLLASCSRSGHVAPGLWGNSLTMDANRAWQGDYHANYNYEAPWWGAYSSNHIAITDPYEAPILSYMQKAEGHAKKYLGIGGVYYPVGIGPWGFCSSRYPLTRADLIQCYPDSKGDTTIEDGYMFLGQKSNALFLTSNMFMRWYLTYDSGYARKVYPFLRQVSRFWE